MITKRNMRRIDSFIEDSNKAREERLNRMTNQQLSNEISRLASDINAGKTFRWNTEALKTATNISVARASGKQAERSAFERQFEGTNGYKPFSRR